MSRIDVVVTTLGNVSTFAVRNKKARAWFQENAAIEAWHWLGDDLVVEHRYVPQLAAAVKASGLKVVVDGETAVPA